MKRDTMDAHQKAQQILADVQKKLEELHDVAVDGQIERLEFLGGYIHFGVQFTQSEYMRKNGLIKDPPVRYRDIDGFVPAAKGPIFSEMYWSASHFECWAQTEERAWLHGDDKANWPKTDYEDDD